MNVDGENKALDAFERLFKEIAFTRMSGTELTISGNTIRVKSESAHYTIVPKFDGELSIEFFDHANPKYDHWGQMDIQYVYGEHLWNTIEQIV
jgi:hypothetical protein